MKQKCSNANAVALIKFIFGLLFAHWKTVGTAVFFMNRRTCGVNQTRHKETIAFTTDTINNITYQ